MPDEDDVAEVIEALVKRFQRCVVAAVVQALSDANCGLLKQLTPKDAAHLTMDVLTPVAGVMDEFRAELKKALAEAHASDNDE